MMIKRVACLQGSTLAQGLEFWKSNECVKFVEDSMFDKPGLRSSQAPEVLVSRVHLS